jgi:acyl-CoA synthetase (NDP forming)
MAEINLDRLFNPKTIAMIGASANPRKWGFIILLNILKGNYSGKVFPVNPKENSILGYPCYPKLSDIPEPVDLAIITTPATAVLPLMDECGEKGIPFAIVITSDFSETGAEGAALERRVVAGARKYGIRLVGPNSMGIFSSKTNLHAQMPPLMPLHGSISMFSQSGNLGVQMLGWGAEEGVGFEKFVSSGNEGDLSCADYLRYFGNDQSTEVILGYLEGVDPGMNLVPVAREISLKKPIIVYKGGRTAAGGHAAATHTGAMAGQYRIFECALRQAGVLEVMTSQALLDCGRAFANCPLPAGNRVGIITRGGGWGVITVDACEENNLKVPPLPDEIVKKLDSHLPKYWSRGNPVDLVATIAHDPYLDCLEILTEWDGIDAVIALGAGRRLPNYPYSKEVKGPQPLVDAIQMASLYIDDHAKKPDWMLEGIGKLIERTGKPIIVVSIGPEASHRSNLYEFHVVSYPTPERAVRVLWQMYRYRRFLDAHVGS